MSTGNAHNAIWKGFLFNQDITVNADDFPEEAVLWLDLRKTVAPKDVLIDAAELTRVNSTTYRLDLTEAQTGGLPIGMLEGDFILRIEGVDEPLGWRIQIPVLEAASEPRP